MSIAWTFPSENPENKKYKQKLMIDTIDGIIYWKYDFNMTNLLTQITSYPIEILSIIADYTKDINMKSIDWAPSQLVRNKHYYSSSRLLKMN